MKATILIVFLGGGLGSMLRYGLSEWLPSSPTMQFPWATFWANLLASLILGVILGISLKTGLSKNIQLFFIIGFCGGFSTFSTFSKEVFLMIQSGAILLSLIYVLSSIAVCILAIYLGSLLK